LKATKPIIGLANTNSVGIERENPVRVLHVDDDSNFLVVAKRILEMRGPFQVDSVLSVKEAFERIREKEFE
jgi:ActR/RegA family two-component response regulator